jgi:hypothetical protein
MKLLGRLLNTQLLSRTLVPKFLNYKLNNYQITEAIKVLECKLDLKTNNAFIKVELAGEVEPVEITIDSFKLSDNKLFIHSLTTSKRWLTIVAEKFIIGKELDVPESVVKVLAFLK